MSSVTMLFVSTPHLLAYLDPGSGSMLFQVMVAGLISSMVFWKSTLQTISQLFRTSVKIK
jgi:hypothetical protein